MEDRIIQFGNTSDEIVADFVFKRSDISFDDADYLSNEINLLNLIQYKLPKKTVLKVFYILIRKSIAHENGLETVEKSVALFRQIISHMIFKEEDTDNYVAMLLNSINSKDFKLETLKQYIENELGEVGKSAVLISEKVGLVGGLTGTLTGGLVNGMTGGLASGMTGGLLGENVARGSLVGQIGTKPIPHMIRVRTGEKIYITKTDFRIGKSKLKTDYSLENNMAISRLHCTIEQKDGINYIVDNNSTNHTFVDGIQIEPGVPILLKNKSKIKLGDEEFIFYLRKSDRY